MEYIHKLLPSIQIEVIILLFTSMLFALLYFFKYKQISDLKSKAEKFLNIFSKIADESMIIFSNNHKIISASPSMRKYIHIKDSTSLDRIKNLPMFKIDDQWIKITDLIDIHMQKSFQNTIFITHAILRVHDKDKPVNLRFHSFSNKKNGKAKYLGMAIFDITDKLELSKIHYQNTTTGLPNHNKAIADIGLMVNKMQSENKKFALIIMSIGDFTEVISILGYQQSLSALSNMAKYFQKASEELGLSIYHMIDNNFLILAPDIQSDKDTISLVDKFKNDTDKLLYTHSNTHFTISSGISIYPDNEMRELLNTAYKALSVANKQGMGYNVVFNKEYDIATDSTIGHDTIKKALKSSQFSMYYQPILDTKDETVVAAEALMRWVHPTKGFISPEIFIPIAEQTGLISEISKFAITSVIMQLGQWNTLGFKKIQVAINLSLRELESANPNEHIASLLERHQVRTSQIKIEVTENIAMNNQKQSHRQFSKLKALGIDISLDDFGTGHSSFSMLKAFPINTVKIDKSFILDISVNKDHQNIVKAMIAMIHTLGMKVIAEGVEDISAVQILNRFNCDYLQGYYYGKPMPSFEFQDLIRSDKQGIYNQHATLDIN